MSLTEEEIAEICRTHYEARGVIIWAKKKLEERGFNCTPKTIKNYWEQNELAERSRNEAIDEIIRRSNDAVRGDHDKLCAIINSELKGVYQISAQVLKEHMKSIKGINIYSGLRKKPIFSYTPKLMVYAKAGIKKPTRKTQKGYDYYRFCPAPEAL